jgi:hypothetical protein
MVFQGFTRHFFSSRVSFLVRLWNITVDGLAI